MIPEGLPYPIIFGKDCPRLNLKYQHNGQVVFSRTNYNLFIGDGEVLGENDTFSLGNFLLSTGCLSGNNGGLADRGLGLNARLACESESPCPMLIESVTRGASPGHKTDGETPPSPPVIKLRTEPGIEKCPLLSQCLGQLQTAAERRFFELYCKCAIAGMDSRSGSPSGIAPFRPLAQALETRRLEIDKEFWNPRTVASRILRSATAPALIPQVWLNFLYDPKATPAETERRKRNEIASRVDFVLIEGGQKHIIEIDGPSHYAYFNTKTRRFEVSEGRYTRNLRIERRLRQEGWVLHKFSNLEIMGCDDEDIIHTIREELGLPLHDHVRLEFSSDGTDIVKVPVWDDETPF